MTILVHCLVALFGSSSWLSVNSIWMELPIMVNELPEGWNLPSYLAAIVQLASIGPLIYSILHKCTNVNLNPAPIITTLLIFDCICTLLLVLFWDNTTYFAGKERSTALFIIFFALSFVNCTSNVLFLPYMAIFEYTYMTAYFIGMGLSALVPSALALIQGSGHVTCVTRNITNGSITNGSVTSPEQIPARFSVAIFHCFMFVWMVICTIGFIFLNWASFAKRHRKDFSKTKVTETDQPDRNERLLTPNDNSDLIVETITPKTSTPLHHSPFFYAFLLIIVAWVCALQNGIITSIQSFATIPYGQLTYHLAVTLANIANPVACFIPFVIGLRSPLILGLLTLLASGVAGYIVGMAALSPEPLLVGTEIGSILCILACICAVALLAYIRTVTAGVLHEGDGDVEGRLFWCGFFSQVGSFLGAMVMFPLVNVYHVFKAASYYC